jgi:hypothetical protein
MNILYTSVNIFTHKKFIYGVKGMCAVFKYFFNATLNVALSFMWIDKLCSKLLEILIPG